MPNEFFFYFLILESMHLAKMQVMTKSGKLLIENIFFHSFYLSSYLYFGNNKKYK